MEILWQKTSASDESDDNGSGHILSPSCAITSITAGSSLAKGLPILRRFRDEYLKPSQIGQFAIHTYYSYSPIVANYINNKPAIKLIGRIAIATAMINLKSHFDRLDMKKTK